MPDELDRALEVAQWFAELYAGYKSKKLRPEHPARKFLDQLST